AVVVDPGRVLDLGFGAEIVGETALQNAKLSLPNAGIDVGENVAGRHETPDAADLDHEPGAREVPFADRHPVLEVVERAADADEVVTDGGQEGRVRPGVAHD